MPEFSGKTNLPYFKSLIMHKSLLDIVDEAMYSLPNLGASIL